MKFFENNLTLVFLLACALGLAVPGLERIHPRALVFTLAAVTFISCFRLQATGLKQVPWKTAALFTLLRYIALPFVLWWAAKLFLPGYATAVLLLALIPAGVSSPAFAVLFGGEVAMAMAVTLLSSLVAIAAIPLAFSAGALTPAGALLQSLLLCLILPVLIYWPLKRSGPLIRFSHRHGRPLIVLLISLIIALAVAQQREIILAHPLGLLVPLAVIGACFVIFTYAGWYMLPLSKPARIALTTCSAYNNAALGVSLAALHFGPQVLTCMVAGELCWAVLPSLTARIFARK